MARIARRVIMSAILALGASGLALTATPASSASVQSGAGDCIARHPTTTGEYQYRYTAGCSGHDEPELDPVSSLAGSARDLTWTAVLPTDGTVPVSSVGPTFWWGGTVTDPNPQALFGQAFLELQFYPDAIVNTCSSDGGFNVTYAPNKFSVCSPAWQVTTTGNKKNAAFNAEQLIGKSIKPSVMNGGDTHTIHFILHSLVGGRSSTTFA